MKTDENGLPHAEENFEEALKAVNYAINPPSIPTEVQNILDDDKCINLTVKVNTVVITNNYALDVSIYLS